MPRISRFLSLFVLAIVFSSAAMADTAPSAAYLDPSVLPPQLLAPPPEEKSSGWQEEITRVIDAQKDLSADDLTAIRDEQHMRLGLIAGVIGNGFTPEHFPKTYALLIRVMDDTESISSADKNFWHTRRPYLTDTHVKLLVDPIDNSPSYPSGHTSSSRVAAEVLGMLFPDRLPALRARAMEIAWHRVEAGVHYPVDIQGGNNLAMLIVGALMENNVFLGDLSAARQEVADIK